MRATVFLLPILFALSPNAVQCVEQPKDAGEVVCSVNGERIRRREVEDRMPQPIVNKLAGLRQKLTDMGRTEAEAQDSVDRLLLPVFRQTLREIVRERLMLQEATREGMVVNALLVSETFDREWDALKERELAGKPGYEEKTVREQVYRRLLLQTFRRQKSVSRDEEAWFREALKHGEITDGGDNAQPIDASFFFPNDRAVKDTASRGPAIVVDPVEISEP